MDCTCQHLTCAFKPGVGYVIARIPSPLCPEHDPMVPLTADELTEAIRKDYMRSGAAEAIRKALTR